jgi:hypothetical protein
MRLPGRWPAAGATRALRREAARLSGSEPDDGYSVETELVALDVLHDET